MSRYHAIISYFTRLPSRKIKKFPVPWVYLIPFPVILKSNFPISRLKKWQIPRPKKALLGPVNLTRINIIAYSSFCSIGILELQQNPLLFDFNQIYVQDLRFITCARLFLDKNEYQSYDRKVTSDLTKGRGAVKFSNCSLSTIG